MLNTIKVALIDAHKNNNSRAISTKDCERLGISEQALNQWVARVGALHEVTKQYLEASHKPETTDKKLSDLRGAIYGKWRDILKQGTEKDFCRAFYMRKDDVTHIAGLCGEKFISTAIGKRMGNHTATEFRRNIETFVGVRMVVGGYLEDETATTIIEYEGALKTIKSCVEAIEGVKRGKVEVPGLRVKVTALNARLAKQEAMADKFKLEGDARTEFLEELKGARDRAQESLDDYNKKLDAAITKRDNLKEKYESTIAKLHIIDETF